VAPTGRRISLDDTLDALAIVNGVAVLALVGVTAWYAWQTREMVREMRRARVLSLLPKLVLDVKMVGPTFGVIVVRNVGTGPALDAELTLVLEGDAPVREEREFQAHVIAQGEQHEFLPPDPVNSMDELVSRHPTVALVGGFRTAFDEEEVVRERIDIAEVWRSLKGARRRWRDDPAEVTVRRLEEMRKELHHLVRAVSSMKP
jgi:hypothetical protein